MQTFAYFTLLFSCVVHATGLSTHGLTSDPVAFSKQPFDILIAGGGTAGTTLAVRLAQTTRLNIGVIEAGQLQFPGQNPLVDTPATVGQSFTNPSLAWTFSSIPQTNVNGRSFFYPRGKMVGGSSGLNAMAWVRPKAEELDIWSRLGISGGWNWKGLLPYMMKTENVSMGDSSAFPGSSKPSGFDSTVLGRKGPVQVGFNKVFSGVQSPYVQSFINVGGVLNQDPANGNNIGVFNSESSVDPATGNRSYAANAYFIPNQGLQNLLVLTNATVSKITVSSPAHHWQRTASLSATGLQYNSNGATYTVLAKKEVILSAGAIQTPQILELSGIGNKTTLSKLNIPVLLDIPTVGENLQDHNSVAATFLLKSPAPLTLDALQFNMTFAIEQQQLYLNNHTGFLTTVPTYSYHPLQSFFSTNEINSIVQETKAEIASKTLSPLQKLQAEIQLEWLTNGTVGQIEIAALMACYPGLPVACLPGRSYVSLAIFGQHLFSRGSVHITSTSPSTPPAINLNAFDYSFDKKILGLGLQLASRIAAAQPLANLIENMTNPASITDQSYISNTVGAEYNAIGTAALAPKALGGVVGDDLLVYGTSNLRVVDASIIPLHLATHIQTIVYAIAEKAAAMIADSP